ncbi:MAG: hypothetical protein ABI353_00865 [Isosphaeraceae bacterium]
MIERRAALVRPSDLRLLGVVLGDQDPGSNAKYLTKDGRKTRARTKTSHSPRVRDVAGNLLGQMARQCLPTKAEFLRLVDCPMDRDIDERRLVELEEVE